MRNDTLVMKSYMANVESKMIRNYTTWDTPTQAQKDSIKNLIGFLKEEYNLSNDDVYEHDDISPQKTRAEAKGLYEKE